LRIFGLSSVTTQKMRDKIVTELFRYEMQTLIGKLVGHPLWGCPGWRSPALSSPPLPSEGWGGRMEGGNQWIKSTKRCQAVVASLHGETIILKSLLQYTVMLTLKIELFGAVAASSPDNVQNEKFYPLCYNTALLRVCLCVLVIITRLSNCVSVISVNTNEI